MRQVFLICFSLFIFAAASSEGADNVPPEKVVQFQEALEIAQTARTREELTRALEKYKGLVESNITNGNLFYNIGNAYFKLGKLGYAILYWKRAQALCPGDLDIEHNLAYGRTKTLEKFEPKETSQVFELIFFWHKWPLKTLYCIALIAFALFWGLLFIRLFSRSKLVSLSALFSLAICLGAGISGGISFRSKQKYPPAVIVAPETDVYQGNSETYEKVFTEPVHSGAEVRILEQRQGWTRIEFGNGENGWIPNRNKKGDDTIQLE